MNKSNFHCNKIKRKLRTIYIKTFHLIFVSFINLKLIKFLTFGRTIILLVLQNVLKFSVNSIYKYHEISKNVINIMKYPLTVVCL